MNDAAGCLWCSAPTLVSDRLPRPRKLSFMMKINTTKNTIALRNPQPGNMGWVVQQHGEIYAREYG